MGLSILEPLWLGLSIALLAFALLTWKLTLQARRAELIRKYPFPPGLFKRLLFAIDAKLNVPDGFHYSPHCRELSAAQKSGDQGTAIHCGGDFSSPAYDGTTYGFGHGGAEETPRRAMAVHTAAGAVAAVAVVAIECTIFLVESPELGAAVFLSRRLLFLSSKKC